MNAHNNHIGTARERQQRILRAAGAYFAGRKHPAWTRQRPAGQQDGLFTEDQTGASNA